MSGPTPVTSPSVDQQVQYFSTQTSTPLPATIVNIWADGPVDVVVNDPSLAKPQLVKRIPYAAYGSTAAPLNTYDTRYVAQLTTGSGLPASAILNTAATEGVATTGASTEPLEN